MATPEENVARIHTAIDQILNQRRLDLLETYWAEDYVDRSMFEGQGAGLTGVREYLADLFERRPELRVTVDDAIGSGDIVATRETWTTSNRIRQVFHWLRLRDGLVVEEWSGDSTVWEAPEAPRAPRPTRPGA